MRGVISGGMVREDPSEAVIHGQRCDKGDGTQHGTRVEFTLTMGSLELWEAGCAGGKGLPSARRPSCCL